MTQTSDTAARKARFLEILGHGPLLLDGAVGTEFYRRGIFLTRNFEELNLSQPHLVLRVHNDYVNAGAQVVTTNSYGANRFRLARFGLEEKCGAINRAAAELAREAAGAAHWVAGSIGPSGLEPARLLGPEGDAFVESMTEQIEALAAGGADLILLETFTHLTEVQRAIEAAHRSAPDLPLLATMRFEPDEKLIDGSEPEAVADALKAWGADVIGANCGKGPDIVFNVAKRMLGRDVPVLARPNAGTPEQLEGRTIYVANPEYFGVYGRRMLKAGIRVVGGCCGTNPAHIHALRGAVRMMGGGLDTSRQTADARTPNVEVTSAVGMPRVPVAERSELARRMDAGKFVVSVEVNPPLGLDNAKSIETARMLKDAGVDVINIADGPRASVRMSNLASAVMVQREVGMEVILHVCCRDRNLLGLQSDLLGAHALGVRNLVIITGDPPKMGDYPDATAVYDVDSIGLLGIVANLNRGIDPAGKSMDEPTRFWVATGAEPAALDYDRELQRLERKAAAGADFVMTQPVYDPKTIERFLNDIRHLDLKVLLGLLPLASDRNAKFIHENIPGMRIPDEYRRRMDAVGGGPAGRAEGVKIAQEALLAARDRIHGAYIMPPLGRYEMAPAILECLR